MPTSDKKTALHSALEPGQDELGSTLQAPVSEVKDVARPMTEVDLREPIAAPSLLNVDHLHPRVRKIIEHLVANAGVICDYPTGSVDFHWNQLRPDEPEAVSIKPHIHVYPRI
jgi:hypothetical protein